RRCRYPDELGRRRATTQAHAACGWSDHTARTRALRPLALPRVGCRRRRVEAFALCPMELGKFSRDRYERCRGDRSQTRLFRLRGGGFDRLAGAAAAAGLDIDDPAFDLLRRLARALQRLPAGDVYRSLPG